jgi:hypothetical protein
MPAKLTSACVVKVNQSDKLQLETSLYRNAPEEVIDRPFQDPSHWGRLEAMHKPVLGQIMLTFKLHNERHTEQLLHENQANSSTK